LKGGNLTCTFCGKYPNSDGFEFSGKFPQWNCRRQMAFQVKVADCNVNWHGNKFKFFTWETGFKKGSATPTNRV